GPGQESRIAGVERGVHGWRPTTPELGCLHEGGGMVEIPGNSPLAWGVQDAELSDGALLKQGVDRLGNHDGVSSGCTWNAWCGRICHRHRSFPGALVRRQPEAPVAARLLGCFCVWTSKDLRGTTVVLPPHGSVGYTPGAQLVGLTRFSEVPAVCSTTPAGPSIPV